MSKYFFFCILLTGCFKQPCLLKAETSGRLPNIDDGSEIRVWVHIIALSSGQGMACNGLPRLGGMLC